jgi:lysophospholipid acyltransferase (LPLAT)-like uncharacterized protein
MKLGKRLLASDTGQAVIAALAAGYIRFVHATTRWEWVNVEVGDRIIDAGGTGIVCFWHGRLLMMPTAQRGGAKFAMLISGHRDGRFIARAVARFGIRAILGSSTRGGTAAARECVNALTSGTIVGVAPDGPRGPRMRASVGAVEIARIAGKPLVPVACSTTRRKVLGSWDRFLLALPFGRGVYVVGDPISPPAADDRASVEAVRRRLEEALNAVSAEADRLTGHAPVEPAPVAATAAAMR